MKILGNTIYEGRNIYSHKRCIKLEVDLEGYSEVPSKNIKNFNDKLIEIVPILKTHRCGIDEDFGFIKRLREGTYLAHICEHIIISIQNMVGIDVAYGKAREVQGDNYIIIYQYEYPRVGIEAAILAVDLINSLIENKKIDFNKRIELIKKILREEIIGPSTMEICNAAKKFELPVLRIGNSGFYQIGYGKQGRMIEASISNETSCISADISCDKLVTKELLKIQNLPVARGYKVSNIIDLLRYAEEIGYPVILKPQFGNKGKGIILDIRSDKELIEAYKRLINSYNDIIIEKYYEGDDYRVCIVNYKVVAVSKRIPPFIIGDGIKNIETLINELNNDPLRGEDHERPLTKVKLNDELKEIISKKNYNINSILTKGEKIYLRQNANLSTGGTAIDYTECISEENKDICIRAAKAIGLDICGVDICCKDISNSLMDDGVILEINAAPGLRMHTYPSEGKSRNIGVDIINMLYKSNPVNIPVISVTGTNGKTTTTRLINSTLCKMGYSVGMTSTDGIYINGKCIDKGDDTGAESAKCILLNKEVDIAVLETARGGIIKKGLAYDLADIAVVTNITEDHLGCNNVNTIDDLCNVKSLVVEAVKPNGYVVINAEDKHSKKIINNIKANIIYYSKDYNNKLIQKGIKNKDIVVYLKDKFIVVNNCGREYKVVNICKIPITLNGSLKFNIENALAATSALVGLKVDYAMIKIGLENFQLNSDENSGRFNIYNYNGIKVILDYGHNIEGYRRVLSDLREISDNNITGIIGIPGDRGNHVAKEIGKISSKFLNKIIIKEDLDRRGREKGEIAEIIKKSVLRYKDKKDVKVILNEVEALKEAIRISEKGDTIIIFFERIEPLKEILRYGDLSNENLGNVVNSN